MVKIVEQKKRTGRKYLELIYSALVLGFRSSLLAWLGKKHKLFYILRLSLPVLVFLIGLRITIGQTSAFFSDPAQYSASQASEVVSYCTPPSHAGETWVYTCQAETMNKISYFDIWEDSSPTKIDVNVSYHCYTGDEGFSLGTGDANQTDTGTWSSGAQTADKNACSGGNGSTGALPQMTLTPTSSSRNCSNTNYGSQSSGQLECEVIVSVNANDNASSSGYEGGSVQVTIAVSGTNNPIVSPASSSIEGSASPAQGNPDALSGGGWTGTARQFGETGSNSYYFKAACDAGNTAYVGWEGVDVGNPNYTSYSSTHQPNVSFQIIDLRTNKVVLSRSNNGITPIASQVSWSYQGGNYVYTGQSYPGANNGNEDYFGWMRQNLNTVYSASFPVNAGDSYEWEWSGVGGNDNVTYSVPFSLNSNSKSLDCWQLTPESNVGSKSIAAGTTTPFNHRVGNYGPNTASYTWKVQGCYYTNNNTGYCGSTLNNPNWYKGCSNDTNSNGINTNAGAVFCNSHGSLPLSSDFSSPYVCSPGNFNSPNYCPDYAGDRAMVNYGFPGSAQPGDGYCQRIYATDAYGPNSSDRASKPVCVSFVGGPNNTNCTNGTCTATCTTVNFDSGTMKSGASGNMYYAVYAYTSTGSSTSPYNSSNDGSPSSWTDWPTADSNGNDSASVLSSSTPYPDVTTNSLTNPSGSNNPYVVHSAAFTNRTITYKMTHSQLLAGNVTWYAMTFNVWPGQGSGPPYYLRIDNIFTTTVNDCFATRTCSIDVNSPPNLNTPNDVNANSSYTFNVTYQNNDGNQLVDSMNLSDGTFGLNPAGTIVTDNLSNHIVAYTLGSAANYYSSSQAIDINTIGAKSTYGPTQDYSFTAPNDTNSNTLAVSAGYPNTSVSDLIDCSTPVNDYQQFSYTSNALAVPIKSQADQQQTTENPGAIKKTYVYSESGSSTAPNNLNITGGLYYIAAGGAPPSYNPVSCGQPTQVECDSNLQQSSSPVTHYYTIPGTPNAGDSYCILVSLFPSTGYVGPGGNYLNPASWPNTTTNPSPASGGCTTIHNEPYVSVTGNDVIGNADFNTTCQQPASSGIYTFNTNSSSGYTPPYNTSEGTGGSASQFGAEAVNIIEGFGSASFRNSSNSYLPKGSNALGLSFANGNDNTSNVTPSPPTDGNPMGGEFGYSQNDSACEPDYFHQDKPLANNTISVDTGSIDSELRANNTPPASTSLYDGYNYYSASSLTIGNGASSIDINNGVKSTIFVNGNVYITSNIDFNGANGGPNGWNAISDIPSFYIVALGNIYIAPNVTQLDGVYIAQPTSETSRNTGIIDTCSNGFQAYSVDSLYGNSTGCNQQLTVNGAFVDQATLLDRSFSSLRYSEAGENTISNFSGHNSGTSCGHPGQDIHNSFGSNPPEDCAAEIFNFSPEIYLSQPSFQPASGPTIGKYNFVTSVSPTL